MNRVRTFLNLFQQWIAALPLLSMLLGMAIHSGFRQGDSIAIVIAIFAVGAVYALAPFMQLVVVTPYAPLLLGMLYTVIPYLFGLINLGVLPSSADYPWLIGLYLVGIGYIALRTSGEAVTKKHPATSAFVARFGRDWACFTSLTAIALGSLFFIWQVHNALWLVAVVGLFLGALAFMIIQLGDTIAGEAARTTITTVDTILNGLLLTLTVAYILMANGASVTTTGIVSGVLTLLFLCVFFWFIAKPLPVVARRRR